MGVGAENPVVGSMELPGGSGGGATPGLAAVLGVSNDGGGIEIKNIADPTGTLSAVNFEYLLAYVQTTSFGAYGNVEARGGSLAVNVVQGVPPCQVRLEPGNGFRLKGQIAFTLGVTGILFTLGPGFRPSAQRMIEQRTQVTAAQVIILFNTDGTVTTAAAIGATALINFDNVWIDL